jgi:hypothetical protein
VVISISHCELRFPRTDFIFSQLVFVPQSLPLRFGSCSRGGLIRFTFSFPGWTFPSPYRFSPVGVVAQLLLFLVCSPASANAIAVQVCAGDFLRCLSVCAPGRGADFSLQICRSGATARFLIPMLSIAQGLVFGFLLTPARLKSFICSGSRCYFSVSTSFRVLPARS